MAGRADVDVVFRKISHDVKRADVAPLVPTVTFGGGEAKDTIIHVWCRYGESQCAERASRQTKQGMRSQGVVSK